MLDNAHRVSHSRFNFTASTKTPVPRTFNALSYQISTQSGNAQVTVTVTVTEPLVLLSLLEDRGRITESIRILVPVDRMK